MTEPKCATNTVADATATVSELEADIAFVDVEPGALSFVEGRLGLGGDEYVVDVERLCEGLNVPSGYVPRLPKELRDRVLDFELARFGGRKPVSLVARAGEFRRFDRADLARISGTDVLLAVAEEIPKDSLVSSLEVEEETLRLELLTPGSGREIRVGDVVRGGVAINHSLVAAHPTTIVTCLLRLVCVNGWTARTCAGVREVPRVRRLPLDVPEARKRMVAQVRRVTREAFVDIEDRLEGVRRLAEQTLRNQSDVERVWVSHLGKIRLATNAIFDELRAAWLQEPELSVYGAMNAMTWVASHRRSLERWKRDRLAALAGVLSGSHTHLCERCYSVLLR